MSESRVPLPCGARTRQGKICRNKAIAGGRCRLHGGLPPAAGNSPAPLETTALPDRDFGGPLPAVDDPIGRLEQLQDAAERRALDAHRAGQDDVQQDAVFNRNARLAATLARTRLALAKAKASGEAAAEGDEDETEYDLPENERE